MNQNLNKKRLFETREKISKTRKRLFLEGKINPNRYWLGKKFSEEHKRKLKLKHKGMLGKKHSEDSKLKMGINIKKNHWSKNLKIKYTLPKMISERNKGKHYSLNTEFKKGNKMWALRKKHGQIKGFKHSQESINKIKEKRLNQITPIKDTIPEQLIQNKLKELNIPFKTHLNIDNIAQPDIFIEMNICIFIDGCYWHGCEQCFDRNKMSGWIKSRKIKDILITQKLIEDNYMVIRLWEHEIKKSIDLCLLQIKDKLNLMEAIRNG